MAARERRRPGDLVLIGGGEDKLAERHVLRAVAERVGDRTLLICTLATMEPDVAWRQYDAIFDDLGVVRRAHLTIDSEVDDADDGAGGLDDVGAVFFTGGDQLRLTSMLGGSTTAARLLSLHRAGTTIAGTSAGASAVSDIMLIGVAGDQSHKLGDLLRMAPGLGFIRDVIVDQHFAQRGRVARLLGAVAQNPSHLGIGIDEDTACIVESRRLAVIGSGAVFVIDGHGATRTNVSETDEQRTMSICDVRLHVLCRGDGFDLETRRPLGDAAAGTPCAARLHVATRSPGQRTRGHPR
jgi:cyanophycinase